MIFFFLFLFWLCDCATTLKLWKVSFCKVQPPPPFFFFTTPQERRHTSWSVAVTFSRRRRKNKIHSGGSGAQIAWKSLPAFYLVTQTIIAPHCQTLVRSSSLASGVWRCRGWGRGRMKRCCCLPSSLLPLMTIYISLQKTTVLHIFGENEEYVSPLESLCAGLSPWNFHIFLLGRWERNHLASLLDLFSSLFFFFSEGDGRMSL